MFINLMPTEEAIRYISSQLRESANKLDSIADKLIDRNDIDYVSHAIQEIMNCFGSLHIDLLYTRTVKEIMREEEWK